MPLQPLAAFLAQNFNCINTVEKHLWLVHDREEGHEQRMKILGNVVVPACAALGAEILRNLAQSFPLSG